MKKHLAARKAFATLATIIAFVWLMSVIMRAEDPAQSKPLYLDPSLPIEMRVNDLIKRMTIQEKASQMQNSAPAIPRLGLPSYDWWSEALYGVARSGYATVFPESSCA